jgi:hypothetical protein
MAFTTHTGLAESLKRHAAALSDLPRHYRATDIADLTMIAFIVQAADVLIQQDRKIGDATVVFRSIRDLCPIGSSEREMVTQWLTAKTA